MIFLLYIRIYIYIYIGGILENLNTSVVRILLMVPKVPALHKFHCMHAQYIITWSSSTQEQQHTWSYDLHCSVVHSDIVGIARFQNICRLIGQTVTAYN